jgi:bacterioferritin-associated ferredoxin
MYVCLCQGVTDSDIQQALSAGARSLRDLREQLGVALECGKCAHLAQSVVRDWKAIPKEPQVPLFYSAA